MNTKEQNMAICHKEGPMMVIAGPGSGKTTVITQRVKYLIEEANVDPSEILVITFTKAAATEMEQRFKNITKGAFHRVRFGTFHSIFFWIVKTAYNLDNSSVISESEKRILVSNIMQSMNLNYDNKEDVITSVLSQISIVKCDMMDIENYYSKDMSENEFRAIYKKLDSQMRRRGKIDFDDMMVMCYDLLVNRKDILKSVRNLFKYILVDEFQDSNRIQYEIFKLLSMPRNNVFVVGDDDQSVYGFRGARPEIMRQFVKDFENTKTVFLGKNFRCDRAITNASAVIIGKNKNRFDKKLLSLSPDEGKVEIYKTKDINSENELIISHIRKKILEGIPYEQMAVLYRTNLQPRRLAYKMNMYNIPYTMNDVMPNIFDHFVVRNIMDYMRLALGDRSRALVLRIINKPGRYINRELFTNDPVDFDKIRWMLREKDYASDNLDKLICDLKLIKKMRPYAAINFIRKGVGYDDYLKEYSEYKNIDVTEFYDILDEFSALIENVKSFGELIIFEAEYREIMQKQKEVNKKRDGVRLMTMHSSKGLEFDTVFIMDAIEGYSPYKKAKTEIEIEEERRMFYVAMTRAKHSLKLYTPLIIGSKGVSPSRYVREIENYFSSLASNSLNSSSSRS